MGMYTAAGTYIGHHTAILGLLCLQIRQAVFDFSTGDLPWVLFTVYLLYFILYIRYIWVPGLVGNVHCPEAPFPVY